jgi:hypothetical protein
MDPYLEHPARWQGVHLAFITYAQSALNAILPARYVADIGERLYIVEPERSIYPDLMVVEQLPSRPSADLGAGGTAVAAASDPSWVVVVHPAQFREPFIRILTVAEESQVVTVLELLSPSNKSAGSEGRELYLTKQRELLDSQTHLIEIDLLRQGEHTVAPPRDSLLPRGPWDYLASLHRGGQKGRYQVWPIPLRQRLPRIDVPLADSDPEIVLDLQAVFDRCYDEGGYARRLDYRRDPSPPLEGEDAEWARQLLRERGLRE